MFLNFYCLNAQEIISKTTIYAEKLLLRNQMVQLETANAMNDLYNFKFESAEIQLQWFKEKYPTHPLPYFLLGLCEWWKIMPNSDVNTYDEKFLAYMDSSLIFAHKIHKKDRDNPEIPFFLSAAYAFKARLHAERGHWTRALNNTRSALSYMKISEKKKEDILSPELLFGEALYNYYSVWLPENYPLVRPVMAFFSKGNKEKGLEQLKYVAYNAFYTRQEAQYFWVRIYIHEEKNQIEKAYQLAELMHKDFPDNPYFHRTFASVLYSMGMMQELEPIAKDILDKIKLKYRGYEEISGRYAAFYLATIHHNRGEYSEAENYYKQTLTFAERIKAYDSYYFSTALRELGRLAHARKDYKTAKYYFNKLKKHITKDANKRNKGKEEAKQRLKEYKKLEKKK